MHAAEISQVRAGGGGGGGGGGSGGGALGLALRVGRVLGAAPRARRSLLVYGRALNAAINAVLLLGVASSVAEHAGPWLALEVIKNAIILVLMVAATVGVYGAPARVSRILGTITQLDEIMLELPSRCRRKCDDRRKIFFIVAYIVLYSIHVAIHIFNANMQPLTVVAVFPYFVSALLLHLTINVTVMQAVLVAALVAAAFAALNERLQELVPADERTTDAGPALSPHAVRRLAAARAALCDAVRAADADGPFLLTTLAALFGILAYFFYIIILWGLLKTGGFAEFPATATLSCALHLVCLVSMVEPFHDTHSEMQRTQLLVHQLQARARGGPRAARELRLFARALQLSPAAHAPLGLCTLQRPMVVKTVGSIVTYLLILLTYGPDMSALARR